MTDEIQRLQSAIAAIHNHLHGGDINAAHEASECALSGAEVHQPNLSVPQSARIQIFAHRFNELCKELEIRAAWLAPMPSATVRGAFSLQIGGEVGTCILLERQLGKRSIFMGEHK